MDTSATIGVAVVTDDGERLLAWSSLPERRRHAEHLTALITQTMQDAGVGMKDLTAVAVGVGPAPYTGLRVGLVTAQTLGLALDIPVWGVPSLDAIAVEALSLSDVLSLSDAPGSSTGADAGGGADAGASPCVLVLTDARRKEVYWALYTADVSQPGGIRLLAGPDVGKADSLLATLAQTRLLVAGEGAELYAQALTDSAALTDRAPVPVWAGSAEPAASALLIPHAGTIGYLGCQRAGQGRSQPTQPLYLRRPDAQVPTRSKALIR